MMSSTSRAFRDELESIVDSASGVVKQAVFAPLLAGAATAAVGHGLTNVGNLVAHHSGINDLLAHRGLQHALTGQKISPISRWSTKLLMGPESLMAYDAAHAVGAPLRGLPAAERQAALTSSQAMGRIAPELKNAPYLGSIDRAIGHHLAGTAPTVAEATQVAGGNRVGNWYRRMHGGLLDKATQVAYHEAQPWLQKAVGSVSHAGWMPVLGAGAAAADLGLTGGMSGLTGHMAWNAIREGIARTPILGDAVTGKLIQSGIKGTPQSRASYLLQNIGGSPALGGLREVGSSIRRAAEQQGPEAVQVAQNVARMNPFTFGHIVQDTKHLAQGTRYNPGLLGWLGGYGSTPASGNL